MEPPQNDAIFEIYEYQDDETVNQINAEESSSLNEAELKENIGRLLKTVVDEDILNKFGYPKAPIDKVLCSVIKQCGQTPVDSTTCIDSITNLRENVKLLFTSVIDDDSIKEMLNNQTIDEVVCHVIKLSEND